MKIERAWLSNREWIFVIILVILSQFILHQYASNMMNETQVINYISFSGTIVSIILAILAIVYSFFQSITQQSNSDKIASNLESLTGVASTVNSSVDKMTSQVDTLNTVVNTVKSLPEDIVSLVSEALEKLNREHVIDMKSLLDPLVMKKAEFDAFESKKDDNMTGLNINQVAGKKIYNNVRWSSLTTTIMACVLIKRISPVKFSFDISVASSSDAESLNELTILCSGVNATLLFLSSFGILSEHIGEQEHKLGDYYYVVQNETFERSLPMFLALMHVYYRDAFVDINEKVGAEQARILLSVLGITDNCMNITQEEIINSLCKA
ncbi:hypothetical protein [Aeromonas veronii]|uniref:hypothetical protein n=1 Tax=Aeromonas veronii TaxID=654 RepID=UPI001A8EB38A|nr:hypothetical protein [Aeromonas veronii]QSR47261.1 hypothetical protein HUI97_07745 [Aeromonas veronii]